MFTNNTIVANVIKIRVEGKLMILFVDKFGRKLYLIKSTDYQMRQSEQLLVPIE